MKILIYSDVHISQDSSIVRTFGNKYSTRLEYIIKSLNWAEKQVYENKCDCVVNLGDTFDKPIINAMEATAIQDITWANVPHHILVGNHDSNVQSLEYSSVAVLKKLGFDIIDKPSFIPANNTLIQFIPYITEDQRKPLADYIDTRYEKTIIMSHNDIAGFNFGGFVSKDGFSIDEINDNCDLFLNGHLHNSSWLNSKILNVGNLCGQNFSEDGFRYKHGVWILDIDSLSIEFIENPFALNFYKILIDDNHTFESYKISKNSVLMIKCDKKYLDNLKVKLSGSADIVAYKINVFDTSLGVVVSNEKLIKVDYLKQFKDYILEMLGSTEVVVSELSELCK